MKTNGWVFGQTNCSTGCYNLIPNNSFECDPICGVWQEGGGTGNQTSATAEAQSWRPVNATPDTFSTNCGNSQYAIPSSFIQTIPSAQDGNVVLGLVGGNEEDAVVADLPSMLPAGRYSLTFWYLSASSIDVSPVSPGDLNLKFYISDVMVSTASSGNQQSNDPFTPVVTTYTVFDSTFAPSTVWTQQTVFFNCNQPFQEFVIAHHQVGIGKKYIFLDNFQLQRLSSCFGTTETCSTFTHQVNTPTSNLVTYSWMALGQNVGTGTIITTPAVNQSYTLALTETFTYNGATCSASCEQEIHPFHDEIEITANQNPICWGGNLGLSVPFLEGWTATWFIKDDVGNVTQVGTGFSFNNPFAGCPVPPANYTQPCTLTYEVQIVRNGCIITREIQIIVKPIDQPCSAIDPLNPNHRSYSNMTELMNDVAWLNSTTAKRVYLESGTPFVFTNQNLIIREAKVYLRTGTITELRGNSNLVFQNSSLESCECQGLWEGIYLYDRSRLMMNGNSGNATNIPDLDNPKHYVRDAANGIVFSSANAGLFINGMAFAHNYMSIQIEGSGANLSNNIQIKKSLFTGERLHKPWYNSSINVLGMPTYTSIKTNKVEGLTIATNLFRAPSLYFTGQQIMNGTTPDFGSACILSERSILEITKNQFKQCAYGIVMDVSTPFVTNLHSTIHHNGFDQYIWAVNLNKNKYEVYNNTFTTETLGVTVSSGDLIAEEASLDMYDNDMTDHFYIAIADFVENGMSGKTEIYYNNIRNTGGSDYSEAAGVLISGNNRKGKNIHHNLIENCAAGITCLYIDDVNIEQNTILTNGNSVIYNGGFAFQVSSIYLQNGIGGNIAHNTLDYFASIIRVRPPAGIILDESPALNTQNNIIRNTDRGYWVNGKGSTNNLLTCNLFDQFEKGAMAFWNCGQALAAVPAFHSTTFGSGPAHIGGNNYPAEPKEFADNTYNDFNGVESETKATDGSVMNIYVRNSTFNPDMVPDVRTGSPSLTYTILPGSRPQVNCQQGVQHRNIKGLILSTSMDADANFAKRRNLAVQMQKDPSLRTLDNIHQQTWQNLQNSDELALIQAKTALAQGDTLLAAQLLNVMTPDSTAANDSYNLMQVKLNKVKNGQYSTMDSTVIQQLSHKSVSAGPAVQQARKLYQHLKPSPLNINRLYMFELTNPDTTVSSKMAKEDKAIERPTTNVSIYPNPNNGEFTINGLGCESYDLLDLTGKVIVSGKLDKNIIQYD